MDLEPSTPHHEGTYERKANNEEGKAYNFVADRPPGPTTNIIESVGHLIKGCLGGGVIAIHEGYMKCGLITALWLNVVLGFLITYIMNSLVHSAQTMYGRIRESRMSYPDLAEASLAIGPFKSLRKYDRCFRYTIDFTICFDLFGSCCVFQVVIARTIKQLVEEGQVVLPEGHPDIRIYILCLLLPCVMICMITSLKYLAPLSIMADIFLFIVAIATMVYGSKAASTHISEFPIYKDFLGLFEFIGMCVFSMEGVGLSLAIENHMTEPKKFPTVLMLGMPIVVAVVMLIGFFGYYGFGELAESPITVNFPLEPFPYALKVSMALMVYVSFALNFWIPFDLVWYYLSQHHPVNRHWFWNRAYRVLFVLGITLLAIAFPNVGNFMGLLGSFCLSSMGFIYPAFIELTMIWDDPGLGFLKWRLWKCVFFCLLGAILCVVGTYTNFIGLVHSFNLDSVLKSLGLPDEYFLNT